MMKKTAIVVLLALLALAPLFPQPQSETPIGPQWWPSRWGADDELGASNWITPDKVLGAAKLIKTGHIYDLGHPYEAEMPLFGDRGFLLRIPASPTGGPFGKNQIIWHDEFLATEIGQVGTQFDGLGHIGVQAGAEGDKKQMRYYNGFTEAEMGSAYGLQKLGVEKIKPLFTAGMLIDLRALKGRMWNKGEEIGVSDLRAALSRQGIAEDTIQTGDVILLHTGWGQLWKNDNPRYNDGQPGIGLEAARWLAQKQVALVGADTWSIEVVPNPNPDLAFPVHQELLVRHGIFLHENLNLKQLADDKVYRFVYVFAPVPIKGATGSPGRPIAIH